MITTEQIKELRDQTGVSVMQCKKALEEAGGDMEKAIMLLKKKSSEIAAKKSDRETADGLVVAKRDSGKTAIISLLCETDFVARNDDFVKLAESLAEKAFAEGKEGAEAGAAELINPVIQKIGENIRLGEVAVIDAPVSGAYVHNGKVGVVVALSGGTEELARDIAMHAAAMKPEYVTREEIPEAARSMAAEIFQKEVEESGKPEDIKKKMLDGKIETYFKERTLLDQSFIKDGDLTISGLLAKASKEAGSDIAIVSLTRVSTGA